MDYGSFKYQREKQERKAKAKQKTTETKTVKISPRIGQHDLEVRASQAAGFLADGDKVKIELQLRGRENQHTDLAKGNIRELVEAIKVRLIEKKEEQPIRIESDITKQGGRLSMTITL
jgi:translation initiation factor IF-3